MKQMLVQDQAAATGSRVGGSIATEGIAQRPAPDREERATAPSSPLLARERRQRSETLAHQLAGARDLEEFVAIVKEHGRSAVARAAAVRPDLMPVINGEFAHIALSLADLD